MDCGTGEPGAGRAAYDRRAQSLVGLRLRAVRYVVLGLGDEPVEPDFDWGADFDHLDYGLELVGVDGRVVGLGWESAFEEFNLAIDEGGLGVKRQPTHDVSDSPRWRTLVGRQVTAVDVRWIEDEERSIVYGEEDTGAALLGLGLLGAGAPSGTGKRPGPFARLQAWVGRGMLDRLSRDGEARGRVEVRQRLFPVALRLTLGTEHIWIGALEVSSDGESWVGADSVTVVADGDVARRLELWE